jgi:hypothetical protein
MFFHHASFAAATLKGFLFLWYGIAFAEPPFNGTIFLDGDIILPTDSSAFENLNYAGRGERQMFDRRANGNITSNAFLFNAFFIGGRETEIRINAEFADKDSALPIARKYARIIGQLPAMLRQDVQHVNIHRGRELFGGGGHGILIHTGQSLEYERDGILEETLVHEATHTSIDAAHRKAPDWVKAQEADGEFISTYARDYPEREDLAESLLLWLAVRVRPDRISKSLYDTVTNTMPARLAYFDAQKFDLFPMVIPTVRAGASALQPPVKGRIFHKPAVPGFAGDRLYQITGQRFTPDGLQPGHRFRTPVFQMPMEHPWCSKQPCR